MRAMNDHIKGDQAQGKEESSESASDDQEGPDQTAAKKYSFRTRRQRVIFTYAKLGQPTTSHV